MGRRKSVLVPALILVAAVLSGPVVAADEDLETVVISARKRAERLIDVPVAAAVVSGSDLTQKGVSGLEGLSSVVPELSVDSVAVSGGGLFTLRGVGSSAADTGIESAVSLNVDGVSSSRGRLSRLALFDLQDVEVLKGPQALYFGKNSPGGVVSMTSVNPGHENTEYVRLGYEPYSQEYTGEGAVNLPLGDGFSARLAVRAGHMGRGYMKNVAGPITDPTELPLGLALGNTLLGPPLQPAYGAPVTLPGAHGAEAPGNRDLASRLTVMLDRQAFDATLKLMYADHKDAGDVSMTTTTGCGVTGSQVRFDLSGGVPLVDPYGHCDIRRESASGYIPAVVASGIPNSNRGRPYSTTGAYLGSLTLNLHVLPKVDFTSVTGYLRYDNWNFGNYGDDSFAMLGVIASEHHHSWSEELRANTNLAGSVNVSAGLYYEKSDRTNSTSGFLGYFGPNPAGFAATGDPAGGRTDELQNSGAQDDQTLSAYSELRWRIAPAVELAGGARYTEERKTSDARADYVHFLLLGAGFNLAPGSAIGGSLKEHNVSPQVTLSWHPASDVLLFAAYKQGFKSGGYSFSGIITPVATADNLRFGQEKARGGEVGLKFSQVLNGALSGSVTAYRYDYDGLQLNQLDPVTIAFFIKNAGSARVQGIETAVRYQIARPLSMHAAVNLNDARYVDYNNASCFAFQAAAEGCIGGVQDLSGQRLMRAPLWTASTGLDVEVPTTARWALGLSADGRYSSSYNYGTTNSPYNRQGGYVVFDAGLRLSRDDGWKVSVTGQNLTDKIYVTFGGDLSFSTRGATFGSLNAPRTVLLRVEKQL